MMKGYVISPGEKPSPTELSPWEALAVDAVGSVIEFWGFKLNHGRVWALLYLRGQAMTALEIQHTLGLSKGAVSMVTRELEQWKVVHKVRALHENAWRFSAEVDFKGMISQVISTREAPFLARITHDLQEAEKTAKKAPSVSPEQLERIRRMRQLSEAFNLALETFIATARLDVKSLGSILLGSVIRKGKS